MSTFVAAVVMTDRRPVDPASLTESAPSSRRSDSVSSVHITPPPKHGGADKTDLVRMPLSSFDSIDHTPPSPGASAGHTLADGFLDSSQDGSRPDGDALPQSGEKPPRQRRRRTSTEDQKVLEAEFVKNPKPDRATRLQIVGRVALGEKEVQIWFQNRRQSCRRRTRLAEAAQSIQVQTGGAPLYPLSHLDGTRPPGSALQSQSEWPAHLPGMGASHEAFQPPGLAQSTSMLSTGSVSSSSGSESAFRAPQLGPTTSTVSTWSAVSSYSQPAADHSLDGGGKSTYLANRRSASFTQPTASPRTRTTGSDDRREGTTPATGSRRSAHLRLSTTVDGKARVVDDSEPSPSPPRLTPRATPHYGDMLPLSAFRTPRSPTLRRAHSASVSLSASRTTGSPFSRITSRRLSRAGSQTVGRAHDSRAWDYCCDPDIRNSLVFKADSNTPTPPATTPKLGSRDSGRTSSASLMRATNRVVGSPIPFGHSIRRAGAGAATDGSPMMRVKATGLNRAATYSPISYHQNHHPHPYASASHARAASNTGFGSDSRRYDTDHNQAASAIAALAAGSPIGRARSATVGATALLSSAAGRKRETEVGGAENADGRDMDMDCVEGLLKLSQGRWS